MKLMAVVTNQQLRNRIARYTRFIDAINQHFEKNPPIDQLVPTFGTGDPAVYENPHFRKWNVHNVHRNRAINKRTACDWQLRQNMRIEREKTPQHANHC